MDGEIASEHYAGKRYRQPATADPAFIARRIADDIVASFLGVRGVAATELEAGTRTVRFSDGSSETSELVLTSLPLTKLAALTSDLPAELREKLTRL